MKNIFLSTLLCLGFFSLISCGGDTNYEKDYKEACAEQDWEKAYQWVEKYKEEADKNRIEAESVNPGWSGMRHPDVKDIILQLKNTKIWQNFISPSMRRESAMWLSKNVFMS